MLNLAVSEVISDNSLEFFDPPYLVALVSLGFQDLQLTLDLELKIFELRNPFIVLLVDICLCFRESSEF